MGTTPFPPFSKIQLLLHTRDSLQLRTTEAESGKWRNGKVSSQKGQWKGMEWTHIHQTKHCPKLSQVPHSHHLWKQSLSKSNGNSAHRNRENKTKTKNSFIYLYINKILYIYIYILDHKELSDLKKNKARVSPSWFQTTSQGQSLEQNGPGTTVRQEDQSTIN